VSWWLSASRSRSSEKERLERRNHCCKQIRPRYDSKTSRVECTVIIALESLRFFLISVADGSVISAIFPLWELGQ
jgi:hypothetical protein